MANLKKYDIGAGYLGNGLTIWNRLQQQQHGDYKTIAHISNNGVIKYYEEVPLHVQEIIERHAKNINIR